MDVLHDDPRIVGAFLSGARPIRGVERLIGGTEPVESDLAGLAELG